ncbi:MAG: aldose epimerase family protein [Peptostreptococcaceae bacterium]
MEYNEIVLSTIDNKDIIAYNIKGANGFEFELINLGGAITKIKTPDKDGNLENIVLGYKGINDYISNPYYYGAIIGRTSGRICKGNVVIENNNYDLNKNYGLHQGHGGNVGFSHRIWDVEVKEETDNITLILKLKSYDGEENYPGNLDAKVSFKIYEDFKIEEEYEAICDKTTLVNMTNHSYFNLSGNIKDSIENQYLEIDSNEILELDDTCVPTGEYINVENTPFDFRKLKKIGKDIDENHEQIKIGNGYDHAFLLDEDKSIYMYDEESKRCMSIITDQKSVVVYSMNWEHDLLTYTGSKPKVRHGICFETQAPPIGRNMCFLKDSVLNKGDIYVQKTVYEFGLKY